MHTEFDKIRQRNYISTFVKKDATAKYKSQNIKQNSNDKTLEWAVGLTSGVILLGLGVLGFKKPSKKLAQEVIHQTESRAAEINLHEPVKTPKVKTEEKLQKEIITSESAATISEKQEELVLESQISGYKKSEEINNELAGQSQARTEEIVTELTETIKNYRPHDITVYGLLNGKWIKGNDDAIINKNILNELTKRDISVLYDKTDNSTQIIMPYGANFYSIKINGIVSEKRAIDAVRSINAFGLANPADFLHVIVRSLNKNLNEFYSTKNVGISYDFHDKGYKVLRNGGEQYASDGRIFLRKVITDNMPWEGTYYSYFNNGQRAATNIYVALPSTGTDRAATNNYTIALAGIISPEKCEKLIKHLNSTVIKNPKDVKEAELPFIQDEVIKFMNSN